MNVEYLSQSICRLEHISEKKADTWDTIIALEI
jgi:hypothetical protein